MSYGGEFTVLISGLKHQKKLCVFFFYFILICYFRYSNIFVTSPSPENLGTVFQLLISGLKSLGFKEHSDYTIVQSSNPDFNKAIIRVNIFRDNRQTIEYMATQVKIYDLFVPCFYLNYASQFKGLTRKDS